MDEPKRRGISEYEQSTYTFKSAVFRTLYSNAALLISTLIYCNFYEKLGIKVPELQNPVDRFIYTLKLSFFSLIPLVVQMFHVMFGRISNPYARNPLSGHEYHVEKANRILTNTVEQLLLHLLNLLIFSLIIKPETVYWLPYLVFCFFIGRVTFHAGYSIHPKHRVFGFVWTFVPTMLTFFYNCANVASLFEA